MINAFKHIALLTRMIVYNGQNLKAPPALTGTPLIEGGFGDLASLFGPQVSRSEGGGAQGLVPPRRREFRENY